MFRFISILLIGMLVCGQTPLPQFPPGLFVNRSLLDSGCIPISAPTGGIFDSADFSLFSGGGNHSTVATNQVLSPACTITGATITEDNTASVPHYGQATASASLIVQQYTFTAWIKQQNIVSGARNVQLFVFSSAFSSEAFVGVNLPACTQLIVPTATGTFSAPSVILTQSGGYCKIALSYTGIVDTAAFLGVQLLSGATASYSGNGTSSLGAWGADFRAGAGP